MQDDALEIAVAVCKRFEGFYPRPYLCPAGVPTIGYGTTYYEDGSPVTLKDEPITRARAEELLRRQLSRVYSPQVLRLCPSLAGAERCGALLDFTYNLGASALKGSTLRKRINEGRWEAVPAELRKWVYAAGRKLRGLALRREAEVQLTNGAQDA